MFSTSIVAPSNPSSISGPQLNLLMRAASNSNSKVDCYMSSKVSLKSKAGTQLLFKIPNGFVSKRPFRPVMELQDCTVKKEVDVPASVAYNCYLNREDIPKWMPFISSVKVLEDKPDQSRWTLRYKAFGRDIEFSWLARNLQPIPNQKIHWRSLEGLPNSGAVRFYPRGPSSCLIESCGHLVHNTICILAEYQVWHSSRTAVASGNWEEAHSLAVTNFSLSKIRFICVSSSELTVSYEVPQLLSPVASALQPFLESLLLRGLESVAGACWVVGVGECLSGGRSGLFE
uniref:Coenzyme Q-binding protein COQ10 START domain-containing protein n=1 Tax=Chenopodium quinoa TaxID=63459 RepID=A0A803LEY5_CHEQI